MSADERPSILTTIAIIGIVLGSLGALGSLLRTLGYVVQGQFSDYEPPPQVQASAREFAERMTEAAGACARRPPIRRPEPELRRI
jgi:hypothetical protein